MNVKLLRRVRLKILEEPRQFIMRTWFLKGKAREIPNCHTAACIGGWAVTLHERLNPLKAMKKFSSHVDDEYYFMKSAFNPGEVLELSENQGNRLFDLQYWPWKFKKDWKHHPHTQSDYENNAKVAARRIDHFIRTKGRQ